MDLSRRFVVVRGGRSELPPPGTVFSGAVGATLKEAAAGVQHGTIRSTTVAAILADGGSVILKPEMTRRGLINDRHVDITEGKSPTTFSQPFANPVPKERRIG